MCLLLLGRRDAESLFLCRTTTPGLENLGPGLGLRAKNKTSTLELTVCHILLLPDDLREIILMFLIKGAQ